MNRFFSVRASGGLANEFLQSIGQDGKMAEVSGEPSAAPSETSRRGPGLPSHERLGDNGREFVPANRALRDL